MPQHDNDIEIPALVPCAGCGARFSDKQECMCSAECKAIICEGGRFCAHTVECEQCHCHMLRIHAYDNGDHYLCTEHGAALEDRKADPHGRPAGFI